MILTFERDVSEKVYGDSAKDKRIGRELRSYLWFNVGDAPWTRKVSGILVQRGVIAVTTEPSTTVHAEVTSVRMARAPARLGVAARPGPRAAPSRRR